MRSATRVAAAFGLAAMAVLASGAASAQQQPTWQMQTYQTAESGEAAMLNLLGTSAQGFAVNLVGGLCSEADPVPTLIVSIATSHPPGATVDAALNVGGKTCYPSGQIGAGDQGPRLQVKMGFDDDFWSNMTYAGGLDGLQVAIPDDSQAYARFDTQSGYTRIGAFWETCRSYALRRQQPQEPTVTVIPSMPVQPQPQQQSACRQMFAAPNPWGGGNGDAQPQVVDAICSGNEGSTHAAECYLYIAAGRVPGAWNALATVALCKGSTRGTATAECYRNERAAGRNVRKAIANCRG